MTPESAFAAAELDRILETRQIQSRYQPIIDLGTGRIAAFEALARGPQGSPLEFPDRLFRTAREQGRLQELDAACRAAALEGARSSAIGRSATLFVNTEPDASGEAMAETYETLLARGNRDRVVFELTERALTDRPSEVLAAAHRLRQLGVGIALDDVGVDPRSLALLPFVQPDIVKLDMSIIREARSRRTAEVMHAVGAYAERTGASIVAEGIEHEADLSAALALGATHGQGWHFGRPEAPPGRLEATSPVPLTAAFRDEVHESPFDAATAAGRPVRVADKALILALTRQLETHAETLGAECVVLGNLQRVEHLTPSTRRRYRQLAEKVAFAGLIGVDVPSSIAPGVRGGSLDAGSRLAEEWTVAIISPHVAAAVVARDLGDVAVPDMSRRFAFCLTYDRDIVARAAHALMAQIADISLEIAELTGFDVPAPVPVLAPELREAA